MFSSGMQPSSPVDCPIPMYTMWTLGFNKESMKSERNIKQVEGERRETEE